MRTEPGSPRPLVLRPPHSEAGAASPFPPGSLIRSITSTDVGAFDELTGRYSSADYADFRRLKKEDPSKSLDPEYFLGYPDIKRINVFIIICVNLRNLRIISCRGDGGWVGLSTLDSRLSTEARLRHCIIEARTIQLPARPGCLEARRRASHRSRFRSCPLPGGRSRVITYVARPAIPVNRSPLSGAGTGSGSGPSWNQHRS
jgi:hypothetical protein